MATSTTHRLFSSATLALALAGAAAVAAPTEVVWVDNDSFAWTSCAGSNNALPGGEDPEVLMRSLRERGLADAGQAVRLNGKPESIVTLTPISVSWRCDGAPSPVVFRMSTFDRVGGQAYTSNLVSRLPAPSTPLAANR